MKLKSQIILFAIIFLLISIACVIDSAKAQTLTEYENFGNNTSGYYAVYGSNFGSESFTVGSTAHTVTEIYLFLAANTGTSGTATIAIYATSNNLPTGTALTSTTFNTNTLSAAPTWYSFSVTSASLNAETTYAIVYSFPTGTSSNFLAVLGNFNGGTQPYSGGYEGISTDSGSTWTANINNAFCFEIWGYASPTSSITITSSPSGSGFVVVDGNMITTPDTFVWVQGSTHTLSTNSPVSGGAGTQYVFGSWSDSGTQSHSYTVPSSPTTVTASFTTQYYITVSNGGYGSPSQGSQWVYSGSSFSTSVSTPVSTGTGTQEVCASPTLSIGSVTSAQSLTFSWQAQCYLTVTGGSSTSGQGWYVNSGTATASSSWVWGTSGGTRSALTNWQLDGSNQNPARQDTGTLTTSSITMSAPHTVNFVSTTQYFLTVSGGNSISYGTASPTSDNWYDSGTSTTVSSNWVWSIVSGQSQYAITNYAIDGSNQNPTRQESGTLTTSSVTMNTYHTVAFASTTQYYFSVSSSYGSPTGQAWYDTGSSVSSTVTTPTAGTSGVQYVTSGWTGQNRLIYFRRHSRVIVNRLFHHRNVFNSNLELDNSVLHHSLQQLW